MGFGISETDPKVQACRYEARESPEVRALGRAMPASAAADAFRAEIDRALGRAYLACLEREGLIRRSGVAAPEAPRDARQTVGVRAPAVRGGGLPLGRPQPTGY